MSVPIAPVRIVDLDSDTGTDYAPATALLLPSTSGAVVVDGSNPLPVTFSGGVEITNDTGNPIPVSDGGGSLTIDGTVAVTDGGGSITVDGTVGVSGTVAVTDNGGSLTVDGTVTVQDGGGSLSVDDGAGSLTVDATSWPLPTGASTEATLLLVKAGTDKIPASPAQDGVDGTGITAPTGGSGIRGWLSGIYKTLIDRLPVLGAAAAAASIPVTLANDGVFASRFGNTSDAAATTDTGTFSLLAFVKRITSRAFTLKITTCTIGSVQTSATGANWVALSSATCDYINVANNTGTALEYSYGGSGNAFPIFSGAYLTIPLPSGNANGVSVRRVDQSNTQVTATYQVVTQ